MSESKISCPHCEQHILLDDGWAGRTMNCPSCGKPFEVPGQKAEPLVVAQPAPQSAGLRINRSAPSSPPPLAPLPPHAGAKHIPAAAQAAAPRTSGLAIASLILSIFGCFGFSAIAAVICGHMARKRIRTDPSLTGGGLALAGLIIGYLMIAFSAFWGTMFAIGVVQGVNEARRMSMQGGGNYGRSGPAVAGSEATAGGSEQMPPPARPAGAVTGSINGNAFTYASSAIVTNMGLLTIRDGEDFFADREVKIFLFTKSGESLEDRTWTIHATSTGLKPHVHLRWQEDGATKSTVVTSGYELRLETKSIAGGVLSGTLDLKVTGEPPAELKGSFTATIK